MPFTAVFIDGIIFSNNMYLGQLLFTLTINEALILVYRVFHMIALNIATKDQFRKL